MVGFDGNLNTGLTLRTIRIKDGVAEVRAGATLLYDSDPDAEEARDRAEGLGVPRRDPARPPGAAAGPAAPASRPGAGRRVLLVDHQDSFVHTLANYFRQTGAEVTTLRERLPAPRPSTTLTPHLVVLSPGPGHAAGLRRGRHASAALVQRRIPVFGVCLGLQGMVEHFGGALGVLDPPVHGKPSRIRVLGGRLFAGLPERVHRRPLPLALRDPRDAARRSWR